MQVWDLDTPSEGDRTVPIVLVSTPEARAVLIDLAPQEEMGEHQVRERAFVHVLAGHVEVIAADDTRLCGAGTLIVFEPSEPHTLRAVDERARLLLHARSLASKGTLRVGGKREPARAARQRDEARTPLTPQRG